MAKSKFFSAIIFQTNTHTMSFTHKLIEQLCIRKLKHTTGTRGTHKQRRKRKTIDGENTRKTIAKTHTNDKKRTNNNKVQVSKNTHRQILQQQHFSYKYKYTNAHTTHKQQLLSLSTVN